MRSLILCEGFDDVLVLGYYLYKTQGWCYDPNAQFSLLYCFPKRNKTEKLEIYTKENNLVGIWAMGGKDAFDKAYKFIENVNKIQPGEGVNKVFIVMDRDEEDIEKSIELLQKKLKDCGIIVSELRNNQKNRYVYVIEDEMFELEIIPVVVPFNKEGALETVLIDGIAECGDEEEYIVKCANKYIDNIIASQKLYNYLQHQRQILKARLSAVISITNPDRSTALFNEILMSWEWEKSENVRRHFGVITKYLVD